MRPGKKVKNLLKRHRESRVREEVREQRWQGKLVTERERDEELYTQQSSSGPQSLFVFSPPSAEPEMPHATHSSTPPSYSWIPATFKSSDLELAAVASLASAELSINNDES